MAQQLLPHQRRNLIALIFVIYIFLCCWVGLFGNGKPATRSVKKAAIRGNGDDTFFCVELSRLKIK
jgi:hypothetical protein